MCPPSWCLPTFVRNRWIRWSVWAWNKSFWGHYWCNAMFRMTMLLIVAVICSYNFSLSLSSMGSGYIPQLFQHLQYNNFIVICSMSWMRCITSKWVLNRIFFLRNSFHQLLFNLGKDNWLLLLLCCCFKGNGNYCENIFSYGMVKDCVNGLSLFIFHIAPGKKKNGKKNHLWFFVPHPTPTLTLLRRKMKSEEGCKCDGKKCGRTNNKNKKTCFLRIV